LVSSWSLMSTSDLWFFVAGSKLPAWVKSKGLLFFCV
jgi:hypothetical protein